MTLADKIEQAEQALHDLAIGKATVRVAIDGRIVEYKHADLDALRAYVSRLRGHVVRTVHLSTSKGLDA